MANFPTLTPSLRTVTPGAVAQSQFKAYGGQESRAQLGAGVHGHTLSLSFLALTFAQAKSIRDHYLGQQGSFVPFDLPSAVWSGFSAYASILPEGYQWIYAEPPQISDTSCEVQSVNVQLVAVFNFVETGFTLAPYSGDLTPTTGFWDAETVKMCSIVPEASPPSDPNFDDVALLLHMDGSNGSTTFTDSSSDARTVSPSGGAQISTTQGKFGGSSARFSADGDYLSISPAISIGAGQDYTAEVWIYVDSLDTGALFDRGTNLFLVLAENSGVFSLRDTNSQTPAGTFVPGAWLHVAVSRASNTERLYINGVYYKMRIEPAAFTLTNIGTDGITYLVGYFDDVRVTVGTARYTGTDSFTPPTAPFPNS